MEDKKHVGRFQEITIFVIIRLISKFKRKKAEEKPEVKPTKEELLLSEIRDILREKQGGQ